MPELPEYRIMSDFINRHTESKFTKIYQVEKGNNEKLFLEGVFTISSKSYGKDLILKIDDLPIHIFMGMSGNWSYVTTNSWSETKFVRLRLDNESGHSLILHGGYLGPKYSVGKPFNGSKRGPDPTRDFEAFKSNILLNIEKKAFDKPVCEVLLNQEFFNGIGNYLRSSILHLLDVNPFATAREIISNNPKIFDLCRDIPLVSYRQNGAQLRDWVNPFGEESTEFGDWFFYQMGLACVDKTGRTFWFHEKWKSECPFIIKQSRSKKI